MGKNIRDEILSTEYSFVFDEKRKDMMCQSFYKYGKASKNYKSGNIDAIGCIEKRLEKFKETKNTEYLLDLANYAMLRYMFPQDGEHFRQTRSEETAGIVGLREKDIEQIKEDSKGD